MLAAQLVAAHNAAMECYRVATENQRQPHAKALSHAPVAPLWSEDQNREPVPIARDAERQVPDARRPVAGSTEG